MPDFIEFQHPRLVEQPPSGAGWLHEIKFDGYRIQIRVRGGHVRIHTRNRHDWTDRFPEIVAEAAELEDCVLDGELCALDRHGRPSFSSLRASINPGKTSDLVVFVFDLLWRGEDDLRPYAVKARKAVLQEVLDATPGDRLRYVMELPQGGEAMLIAACRMHLEGIVSKRLDAPYKSGRPETWVKAKCRPGQEAVIGGWVQEAGRAFKGLLLGVYEGEVLRYIGTADKGFGRAAGLLSQLKSIEAPGSPFGPGGPPSRSENHWTRPELVARVEFAEWTASGKLRQSSFKGLRSDKDPRDVVRERPDG